MVRAVVIPAVVISSVAVTAAGCSSSLLLSLSPSEAVGVVSICMFVVVMVVVVVVVVVVTAAAISWSVVMGLPSGAASCMAVASGSYSSAENTSYATSSSIIASTRLGSFIKISEVTTETQS